MIENKEYFVSFTEASKGGKNNISLIESDIEVFKVDNYFKKNYIGLNGIDAIYDNGNKYFIEFKTGKNFTVSKIFEQIAFTLFTFFKEDESIMEGFNKYIFYLVIEDNLLRVSNGINQKSMNSEIKQYKINNDSYNSYISVFRKLKTVYFKDADFRTAGQLKKELKLE